MVKNLEIVVGTPFYGNKWIGTLPGSDANLEHGRKLGYRRARRPECRRAALAIPPVRRHTISLNAKDITLGTLNFRNTVGTTLAGPFNLVLSSTSAATVTVAGTHIINAGLTLNSDAAINVAGTSDSLTVNGRITDSGAGKGLTLSGSGLLVLANTNNAYSGGTTLNSGTTSLRRGWAAWAAATSPSVAARSNTLPGAVPHPSTSPTVSTPCPPANRHRSTLTATPLPFRLPSEALVAWASSVSAR